MSCENETFSHVRGASFVLPIRLPSRFPDGYFVGWEATSQVVTADGVAVAELVTEWTDPAATRVLTLTGLDTTSWPIGQVMFDVRFRRDDGFVLVTEAQIFFVVHGAVPHA